MATKRKLVKVNNRVKEVIDPVVSGAAVWGSITGTLSSQSDLQSALNTKQAAYAILSTLGVLANASGVLTNNGAGVLSWAAAATGTVTSVGVSSTDLSVSGSPITTSGSITLNVNTNAVTYAKFQQVAALSVVGNGTNALANASAITGTANQVLVVNGAGTSLAFGQVNLSSPNAVTGTLAESKGGTGNNSYAIGDLLYASGATALSKLADVSVGSYLRSGGVTTAPLWSTLKLPNTATQYYVPYPATANNINESSNFQFDGTNLSVGGASSGHRLNVIAGTLTDLTNALRITATMPTVITATNNAVDFQITSAGSSAFAQRAMNINYLAGYTGASTTVALGATCAAAGTNGFASSLGAGNFGMSGSAQATCTGTNVGVFGSGTNGDISVGVLGRANTAKNSATNIGVLGIARNTGSSPIQTGGYFGLHAAYPTMASAALMCDNGSETSDIFVARDNGTAKFKITDLGNVVCSNAALATNATDGFLYIPTCAGTPTGVPTAQTGTVAMVFDTTNNKLYIYDGGWLGGTTPGAFT